MKLKIKTNSGWFAVDCPESEATRHHEDKNEKGCYSESKINSRVEWDFNVKKYNDSGDKFGITVLDWQESVTITAKAVAVASAVALAVTAVWVYCSAWIATTLGAATPAVLVLVAAAAVTATVVTIGTFVGREREYIASFITATGELVSEDEADKIKNLNKTKIKEKLSEIDNLLNDSKVDTFDIDKAKESLIKFDKEYSRCISDDNKAEYTRLTKKQVEKYTEYTAFLLKEAERVMEVVAKNFDQTEKNFIKAAEHREEIHKQTLLNLDKLSDKILASRVAADQQFEKAKEARDELQKKTEKELNITKGELTKLRHELDIKFSEAAEHRKEIYEISVQQLAELQAEILLSREETLAKFEEAKEARKQQYQKYMDQFDLINKQHEELRRAASEEFEVAKSERQKLFQAEEEMIKNLHTEVIENRKQMSENFSKAQNARNEQEKIQEAVLNQLNEKQQTAFAEARKGREKYSSDINEKISELQVGVKKSFEAAIALRKNIYSKTQKQLCEVGDQALESRKFVDAMFTKATNHRNDIYKITEEKLVRLEQEIEKSREQAEKKFDEAFAAREASYNNTSYELGKNRDEILKSREEMDKKFQAAAEHRNKIYGETKKHFQAVNAEISEVREKCDENFKKSELDRNKIYEKTTTSLKLLDKNVNELRGECDSNFKKAEEERKKIFNEAEVQVEKITLALVQDTEYVKLLQNLREKTLNQLEQIDNRTYDVLKNIKSIGQGCPTPHEKFIKIKAAINNHLKAFQNSEDEVEKADNLQTEIESVVFNKMLTESERQSKLERLCMDKQYIGSKTFNLSEAIRISTEAAYEEGKKYNLEEDKFGVINLLKHQLIFSFDKSTKTVLANISKSDADFIKVYKDIKELKIDVSNSDIQENKIKTLEDLVKQTLEENSNFIEKAKSLEAECLTLKEDLNSIFEIMSQVECGSSCMGDDYDTQVTLLGNTYEESL